MPKEALTASKREYASTGAELAASIRRTLRMLMATTVLLFLLIIVGGIYTYTVSRDTNDSLCAFRTDLQSRIDQTEEFLTKNTKAEPFPGVTRETLLVNLEGQKRTVKVFKDLNCPPLLPTRSTPK